MKEELTKILEKMFPPTVWDDSAGDTAGRVIRYWQEYGSLNDSSPPHLTTFKAYAQQLIVVKDIEFSSICAHHLLPFLGIAHVGYLPHKLMIGVSKVPRVVRYFATRPQTQERLTKEIASYLKDGLEAKGIAVYIEAQHTCMACRGVRSFTAKMVTSEMRGVFLVSDRSRAEFMEAIK